MSLSSALHSAQTGLAASQSLARVTAGNVSNAMTPGYVRRDAILTSQGGLVGGGVVVSEIRREVDVALANVARQESAKMIRHQAVYEGLRNYTVFLGQPDDAMSPASRFSEFSSSITTLVNQPSANGAHLGVIVAAEELAASVAGAHNHLAQVGYEVDMEIRYEVSDLNRILHQIADLNPLANSLQPKSVEAVDYHDQIDRMIDEISQITEVKVMRTTDGWVNIYTATGAALLEGDAVHDVTYNIGDGSFHAGAQEITPGADGVHGLENGSLAGLAELKTDILPRFQLQLDEYARTLIQSFEEIDTSLAADQAGLFTDAQNSFDPGTLEGLAGRIEVNELVQVAKSSEVWRIRSGLGATEEGDASDTTFIQAMIEKFEEIVDLEAGAGLGANIKFGNLASEIVANQHTERAWAETKFNSAKSAAEVIQASRRSIEGVNIDEEMQRLTMIERSFAANSRLLQVIGEMYDALLAVV